MTSPIPPSLERFGNELDLAAHRVLRDPAPTRARVRLLRRPRVLAGSSLGLAGVGVAILLTLSGSTETAPAYAITQNSDGTVLLKINFGGRHTLAAANTQLIDRYHEVVTFYTAVPLNSSGPSDTAPGPSTHPAPIACTPTADQYAPGNPVPSGPHVKLLISKDNTFRVPSGNTGGGGTMHLVSCQTYVDYPPGDTGSGNSGNTGATPPPGTLTAQPNPSPGTTDNTGG